MANSSASLPRSAAGEHNPWLIAVVVSLATFMEVLDTTIANVALRHIAGGLGASQDEATWILTSYLISNAIILPVSGWLATLIGRKKFYMICVALFTGSSFMCALSPNLATMVFFRVLQGLGGGGLAPTEQSIFADTFAPADRAKAFAFYGVTVIVAPAIGPLLGGWLTDSFSWHWIFLINLPVGVLALTLIWFLVDEPRAVKDDTAPFRKHFIPDWLGFILVASTFGCLQVVLDKFINLSRNLGGSIGVAAATSELAWRIQFHHERIGEQVSTLGERGHQLAQHGLAATQQAVNAQAQVLSYLDIFYVFGLMALVVVPIAFLLKTPPAGAAHGR